jgi:hypothetical protein
LTSSNALAWSGPSALQALSSPPPPSMVLAFIRICIVIVIVVVGSRALVDMLLVGLYLGPSF